LLSTPMWQPSTRLTDAAHTSELPFLVAAASERRFVRGRFASRVAETGRVGPGDWRSQRVTCSRWAPASDLWLVMPADALGKFSPERVNPLGRSRPYNGDNDEQSLSASDREPIVRDAARVEFEWVFRSAYPSVLRTVFVILHDQGRAEEVTQDAFVRLYERWRGPGIDRPEAWVRKVAVRLAIKQARRNREKRVVTLVDQTGAGDPLPDVDLARAIAWLPTQQRAAVALFYLEDRPVDEVAQLLGVSTSTAKQHLHRARTRLAELLAEDKEGVPGDVN